MRAFLRGGGHRDSRRQGRGSCWRFIATAWGRASEFMGPIYIADAALYLKAHNPELGITDPYELTQAQFDAAVALLQGAAQDRLEVLGRLATQVEDFKTEGFVAAPSWPYQVNLLVADGRRSQARSRKKVRPGGRIPP